MSAHGNPPAKNSPTQGLFLKNRGDRKTYTSRLIWNGWPVRSAVVLTPQRDGVEDSQDHHKPFLIRGPPNTDHS